MKIHTSFIMVIFVIITLLSCKEDNPVIQPEPPVPKMSDTLTISIAQETHRSISVNIKTTDNKTGRLIELRRFTGTTINNNYTLVSSYSTIVLDTNIIDDNNGSGLELDTEYGYYAVRVDSISKPTDTSNVITAKTLAATSHDFTAQIFTFGDFNSSRLEDVAIIDKNNIWAVGEIYLNDSTGQNDVRAYCAINWNGKDWLKKQVYFNSNSLISFVRGISILNEGAEIYFAAGSIFKWDGKSNKSEILLSRQHLSDPNASINKLWITSPSSIYGVGNKGTIVHFNGSSWSSIESGTDLTLRDIYSLNKDDVFICGSNPSTLEGILLHGSFSEIKTFITSDVSSIGDIKDKLVGELATVWVESNGTIYTGGNEIFCYENSKWDYLNSLKNVERGFIKSIRGNAGNDIFMVGDRNTLLHFNGIDWKQIGIDFDPASPIILNKVEIKGNLAVSVGRFNRQAIIIILKR